MASPDSYINWLIRKYQTTHAKRGYSNRRRLANYSILVDDSRLVGRSLKNPITGYNYAYRIRCRESVAKEMDKGLKKMFNDQAWKLLCCVIYTGWTGGWRDVVNMLFWAGLYTETAAWRVRRKRPDRHDITREQFIALAVQVIEEGPKSTRELPVWMDDYDRWEAWAKMYDPYNMTFSQGADPEWVAGALWQRWIVDGDGMRQGISLPSSAAAGHVMARFWLHNGWKSSNPLLWILAAVGHWLGWEYLRVFLDDRKAKKEMEERGESSELHAGIDHKGHAYAGALGLWSGTVRPDNQWQAGARNSIYIRAVSGKL